MNKIKVLISIGLLLSLCTGCVTMPTQEEIAAFDYGTSLTIDHEKVIKEHFENVLFDPYSAHYNIEAPQKYWYKESPLLGNKIYAGYMVFAKVNAKNRMGGYTGMKEYGFLFKNNQIIKVMSPEEISLMKSR